MERDVARPAPSNGDAATASPSLDPAGGYTVVARRYRPQRFEEVVGQDHVVQALRNAITMNRVTHAYLFSGTRGVGKTSIARIFAKCLNCVQGPTVDPCGVCDICQSIAVGQDVDVIEIDGASNNGVEAVRELRQNAGLRPSRARFKIYYIDEVHMLSTGAFNALLKTLEEPPEHVKFFFATTEPNKIPITVLSRCQRYDFAGISPEQIVETLSEICAREGVVADAAGLRAVARRAGGSMRDAQSLLEQLFSYGGKTLTVELIHQALGIAPDDRVLDLIDAMADGDSAKGLQLLDSAVNGGVQPVELLNGAMEFLRDVMVAATGGDVPPLAASPGQMDRINALAKRWSFVSVLAALQILSEARSRLRGNPHGRLVVELAVCRVARLEDLTEIGTLIERLEAIERGDPGPSAKKKRTDAEPRGDAPPVTAAPTTPEPVVSAEPLACDDVLRAWPQFLTSPALGIRLASLFSQVRPTAVEPPHRVVIALPHRYNYIAEECENHEVRTKVESALAAALGRVARFRFDRSAEPEAAEPARPSPATNMQELAADPLVQRLVELFEARKVRVEVDDDGQASP
jgi:DNA polymerase-3 subunit gamma/tau